MKKQKARHAPLKRGGFIMKRKAVGLVIVAVALLMVFTVGCKRWGADGQFTERFIAHLDERVDTLNLTDAQKAQYEAIKNELRINLDEFGQDRQGFRAAMQMELSKEKPDMAMVADNVKQRMRDMAEFGAGNVDLFVEFYNMLDETQQAQVVDIIQKKIERHEKWKAEHKRGARSEVTSSTSN